MSDIFRTQVLNGVKWLSGTMKLENGEKPGKIRVVFVAQNPSKSEAENNAPFSSKMHMEFVNLLRELGFNMGECYLTYAVKYPTYENRTPTATQIKECREALTAELDALTPELILPLGATAFQAVMGGGYKISSFVGVMLKDKSNRNVFPTWAPAFLSRNPQNMGQWRKHLSDALQHLNGETLITNRADVKYEVISGDKELYELLKRVHDEQDQFISLDIETSGLNWMDPDRYIRTVQLCWSDTGCAVIRLSPTMLKVSTGDEPLKLAPANDPCVSKNVFKELFNAFIECASPKFVGHNIRYDGEWLLADGIDIRENTLFDTMLAEHLLDNTSMLGLDDLALKYTSLGKYDGELSRWKKDNRDLYSDKLGYGCVPETILFPYAAADVIAVRQIMLKQLPHMDRLLTPRGDIPSLMDLAMDTDTHDIYEMELTGMPVDMKRIDELTETYQAKKRDMEAKFLTMVMARGMPSDFNHRSVDDVRKLLFTAPSKNADGKEIGGLGLIPIMTTKPKGGQKKKWDWVMKQPPEIRKNYKASTDKQTLEILEEAHPIVYHLLNLRRVDTICKNFLRDDDEGGIKGNIWSDGKLHPKFSQTTDTGRFRSGSPNVQNWSKQAERFLVEIFGKDNIPPPMRSICLAPDGWLFVEADYKQAELFVLAGLSDDHAMMSDLTTPGKDIHTSTTLESFRIQRLWPDMSPVYEEQVIELAKKDIEAFEKLEKTFIYKDARGKIMSHSEFKGGVRTAGKAISFGIPYGRGSQALHFQILAETGMDIPVDELAQAIDYWKTSKYPAAWSYLETCQNMAVDPGWIENPFGRRRVFHKVDDEAVIASNKRESGNFNIQSTVSDVVRIACRNLRKLRTEKKLGFKLMNQIHDALILMTPEYEAESAAQTLKEAMETVEIPLPYGDSMTLKTDLEIFKRWGVKKQ